MTDGKMTIDKLGIMMANVVENMATKDDISELRSELTEKIESVKEELSAKINNLQNRQDVYAGLDRKVETLDKRLTKIEV